MQTGPISKEQVRAIADQLTKSLADEGKIIEGGWQGFRMIVMPKEAPQIQNDEMRKAFYAGAVHLFASIMNILDPGSEPTERDLRRMDQIHQELEAFQKGFELQYGPVDGAA